MMIIDGMEQINKGKVGIEEKDKKKYHSLNNLEDFASTGIEDTVVVKDLVHFSMKNLRIATLENRVTERMSVGSTMKICLSQTLEVIF